MIVQDMKMSRLLPDYKHVSPQAAVKKFLDTEIGKTFYIARTFEYYYYTQHAKGFLKKKRI